MKLEQQEIDFSQLVGRMIQIKNGNPTECGQFIINYNHGSHTLEHTTRESYKVSDWNLFVAEELNEVSEQKPNA